MTFTIVGVGNTERCFDILHKFCLIFHPTSPWLWQVMPERIHVWDIVSQQVRYSCAGVYVGMACDGATFLTHTSAAQGHAWDTATGQEIPIASLNADTYEFHQRTLLLPREDQNKSTLAAANLLPTIATTAAADDKQEERVRTRERIIS